MLSEPVIDDYVYDEVYCDRLHKDRKSGYLICVSAFVNLCHECNLIIETAKYVVR